VRHGGELLHDVFALVLGLDTLEDLVDLPSASSYRAKIETHHIHVLS